MRGHRPLPEGEPKPRVLTPQCPDWFTLAQRKVWDRIVETMNAVPGWITEEQGPLLAVLAESYTTWMEMTRFLSENGRTFEHEQHYIDMNGTPAMRAYPKVRPEVKIQKEARADVLRYSAALGLGPVFKARVNLAPQSEHEDLDLAP